jgi:uncharacterized cysteine cluster protein YcgN (CxxCxxCC family)
MDDALYVKHQEEAMVEYESLCRRCGACCGAAGSDPCSKLERLADGTYRCIVYETRVGAQLTVSGKTFTCVPIRDIVRYAPTSQDCGYRSHH